jgi:phosphoribosyl 1,2-cyclic phosphodiesterase
MAARFTPLASGSAGNACLLQVEQFGVLVDFGLGPRTLAGRLAARGFTWRSVHVALLTHTHGDHWRETTLVHMARLRVRLCCHAAHAEELAGSDGFNAMCKAKLVTAYTTDSPIELAPGLIARPLPVEHDSGACFGFRFEGGGDLFGPGWALGYAADLGCWDNELARSLADVDLLALEFNHDEEMQRASGRPDYLIRRILGDRGHLSNRQAKNLLGKVLAESTRISPRRVVPLHLSRECNRPDLAMNEAQAALIEADCRADVFVAAQYETGPTLPIASG